MLLYQFFMWTARFWQFLNGKYLTAPPSQRKEIELYFNSFFFNLPCYNIIYFYTLIFHIPYPRMWRADFEGDSYNALCRFEYRTGIGRSGMVSEAYHSFDITIFHVRVYSVLNFYLADKIFLMWGIPQPQQARLNAKTITVTLFTHWCLFESFMNLKRPFVSHLL